MSGSKKKKLKKQRLVREEETSEKGDAKNLPLPNLPENFLWMKLKKGTKIRNVLQYALKEFVKYNAIVWSASGTALPKAISCAEFFKRKIQGLHQLTRINYIQNNKNLEDSTSNVMQRVPEIHILLTTTPTHINELGYQGPDDDGNFISKEGTDSSSNILNFTKQITNSVVTEFAAMGLRTGQKRSRKDDNVDEPMKRNKKNIEDNKT